MHVSAHFCHEMGDLNACLNIWWIFFEIIIEVYSHSNSLCKTAMCMHTYIHSDKSAIKTDFYFQEVRVGSLGNVWSENNVKGLGKQNVYESPHRFSYNLYQWMRAQKWCIDCFHIIAWRLRPRMLCLTCIRRAQERAVHQFNDIPNENRIPIKISNSYIYTRIILLASFKRLQTRERRVVQERNKFKGKNEYTKTKYRALRPCMHWDQIVLDINHKHIAFNYRLIDYYTNVLGITLDRTKCWKGFSWQKFWV